ncbi:MAG TPA: hypothetical protein VEQ87_14780 [Burkholderiales bacterium]|nr:hypothetical protein [Burkholderiales bacterium]
MKAQKPAFVPAKSRFLRRKRIVKAVRDVERGLKDTERRGLPNDVPGEAPKRRRV